MRWRAALLEEHRDKVEAMAAALLELETIDADQINDIMEGKPPRPPKQPQVPSPNKPDHNTPDAGPSAAAPA
jgi:cell division protease FtsH